MRRSGGRVASKGGYRSVVIGRGTVRAGGGPAGELRVTLLLIEDTLVMRTDTVEVGTWSARDVSISARGHGTFEIVVDGETVEFIADEPERFEAHHLVGRRSRFGLRVGRAGRSGRPAARTSSRAARNTDTEAPGDSAGGSPPGVAMPSVGDGDSVATDAGTTGAFDAGPEHPTGETAHTADNPSESDGREEGAPPVPAAVAAPRERAADRSVNPSVVSDVEPFGPGKRLRGPWDPPPAVVKFVLISDSVEARVRAGAGRFSRWAGWKARLGWYWALEQLGRIDVFPFNRLPEVTPQMRLEPGHSHVFRVFSATSGLTRHVCTSCGLVLVSSSSQPLGEAEVRRLEGDEQRP